MKNEFDFTKHFLAAVEETNRLFVKMLQDALREEEEFNRAWDKRAAEIKELERMMEV